MNIIIVQISANIHVIFLIKFIVNNVYKKEIFIINKIKLLHNKSHYNVYVVILN